jgi:hypothetical protein
MAGALLILDGNMSPPTLPHASTGATASGAQVVIWKQDVLWESQWKYFAGRRLFRIILPLKY